MTGFECVLEALDIFERSLVSAEGVLSIRTSGELARRAGYSPWHFARLFAAAVGMTPKEYLSGRILTEAGLLVRDTAMPLAQVAESFGFPDYESFSRAFKARFGIAPLTARKGHLELTGLLPRAMPRQAPRARNLASPEPETIELESFSIAGLQFFIAEGASSFHRQWATFESVTGRIAGRNDPETYYQFSSWTDDDSLAGLSVLCGLEVSPHAAQEPVFTCRAVPAATYFRFVHASGPETLAETYDYIYREWFASRDARPADLWEFQRYPDGGKTTEIYIPAALR